MKLPEFDNELQTIETEGGTLAYTGVGQVSFFKLPEFDTTPIRYEIETIDERTGKPVTLQILSGSAPGSVPVVDSTPVLHDRLYPVQWVPGFNQDSEQARGLVAAYPLWDRSGIAQDVVGRQDFQLDTHSWQPDEKLGNVLSLGIEHTASTGGSPQQLRESDGFTVAVWLKRQASGIVIGRLDSDDPDLWRWNLHYSASAVSLRFYTGSFVALSLDVFTGEGWNHLVVSLRKLATDSYAGDVFVNGIYVDSFDETEIVSSEMDTTGNLAFGDYGVSTGRFPPTSVESSSDRWRDETNDFIVDGEASVDDDPTAYTDSTYWRYVYNAVDEWLTPQFVSGHTGSSGYPIGLRFRMVAMIDNHGCPSCTLTVLHRILIVFNNGVENQTLVDWFPGNNADDGIEIPADYEPHYIEVDLDTLPVDGYSDSWAVNVIFSSQGSGSHTVTLYDFDLIADFQALGYSGTLKDLRLYNRPLHASEVVQLHNFAEELYEQPTAYRLVCGRFLEASCTINETTTVATSAVATREATVAITPAASVSTAANYNTTAAVAITPATSMSVVASGTVRASASITPAASVDVTAVKLGGTAVAITPAASVAAAAIKEAVATVAITPAASVSVVAAENAGKEISSSIASVTSVAANAGQIYEASVGITPAASVSVQAKPVRRIAATITPAASVSVAASKTAGLRSSITPATSVSTAANKEAAATVAITPAATVAATAVDRNGIEISCTIAATSAVNSNAGQEYEAEIEITPAASVSTAARRNRFAAVSIAEAANVSVNANYEAGSPRIAINPATSVSAAAVRDREVASGITELSTVNALGIISPKYSAEASIRETSNVTAAATVIRGATAAITPRATVTALANYAVTVSVAINETSKVKVDAEWQNQNLMNDLAAWLEPQLSVYLYPVTLPMQVDLPAITYARQTTDYSYFLDGKLSPQVATTMSFDVFATSYDQAQQLGQEIVDALHGYSGYIGRTRVLSSDVVNVSDSSWYQSGLSCEGIIRSIDVEISHKINTSLTGYDAQDEATLAETLANIVANVSYQPDIIDNRPIVKLERTGDELLQYLGQDPHDPDSVGYQITVSGKRYSDCLALATTIRRALGIAVEDEYDSYDYDSQNTPLYEVVLELSA